MKADPEKQGWLGQAGNAGKYTLEELLPHRNGMLLLGVVVEVDSTQAITVSRVRPEWPMADAYGVAPLICVELAAQTAGVCNGWDRIQHRGLDSDQMGWLVAVKRADFFLEHLPFGLELLATAKNTLVFEQFREVESEIHASDQLVAKVVLQLYQV